MGTTTPAPTSTTSTTEAPTTTTTTTMSAVLQKEVEQATESAELLDDAFTNGDLAKHMLDMPALHQVTAMQLVGKLEVQKADAKTEAPTQLSGECRLSGIRLSQFLTPQRDAFRAAVAASSGATQDQVVITNVYGNSPGRRHLRRRRLMPETEAETTKAAGLSDDEVLVEFAITIERDSATTQKVSSGEQSMSAATVVLITIMCIVILLLIVAGAVVFAYRRLHAKDSRVGVTIQVKPKRDGKNKSKSVELTTHSRTILKKTLQHYESSRTHSHLM